MRGDEHYRNESECMKARVSEAVPAKTWFRDFSFGVEKKQWSERLISQSELGRVNGAIFWLSIVSKLFREILLNDFFIKYFQINK